MDNWPGLFLVVLFAASVVVAAGLEAPLEEALRTRKEVYVATRRSTGEWSAAAPVWFHYDRQALYFTTAPDSHKGRRILRGSPVRVSIGADGPAFEGVSEVVSDRDVIEWLSQAYREKYWIAWMGLFRPRVSRVESGKTLVVRVIPGARS